MPVKQSSHQISAPLPVNAAALAKQEKVVS